MKASAAESEEMTMAVSMLNTDVTWIEKRALVRFWKCKEEIYTEMKKKMHYQECVVIGLLALSSDTGGFRELGRPALAAPEAPGPASSIVMTSAEVRSSGRDAIDCDKLLSKVASVVVTTLPREGTRMRHPFWLDTEWPYPSKMPLHALGMTLVMCDCTRT